MLNGAGDLFVQVQVLAQKAGFKFGINAQHIVHDQHLAISMHAGANANGRYRKAF